MKILVLILAFGMTFGASAQVFKRQSLMSLEALIERIFHDNVPNKRFIFDSEDKEASALMEVASHSKDLRYPNIESNFSFVNDKKEFESLFKADMGLCRGISSLRRKFRLLAFFDPENKSAQVIPDREKEPNEFQRFYKNLVRDIRMRKPTVIPGFSNLHEMSSHPDLIDMMKWQVLKEWKTKNFARGTGTSRLLLGTLRHSTYEELKVLRNRVEAFQKLNHNTMVWLAQKLSGWIHALEAIEVTPVAEDGSFTFTFWNDKFKDPEKAISTLRVNAEGEMTYDDGIEVRTLHAAGITKENDGELLDIAESLSESALFAPANVIPIQ